MDQTCAIMKTVKSFTTIAIVPLALSLLLWGGCSSSLNIFSGPLTMTITGQEDMNGGNAARVRVYELSGESSFRNTPLSTFWRDDEQALGSELVRPPHEVLLYPNENKTLEFEVAEGTKFIGVAANLRNPDRGQWRAIYSVEEIKDGDVSIAVGADRIQVNIE